MMETWTEKRISADRLYLLIWTKYVVRQNQEKRVFIIRLSGCFLLLFYVENREH